jgi:hypothetical protein
VEVGRLGNNSRHRPPNLPTARTVPKLSGDNYFCLVRQERATLPIRSIGR